MCVFAFVHVLVHVRAIPSDPLEPLALASQLPVRGRGGVPDRIGFALRRLLHQRVQRPPEPRGHR